MGRVSPIMWGRVQRIILDMRGVIRGTLQHPFMPSRMAQVMCEQVDQQILAQDH